MTKKDMSANEYQKLAARTMLDEPGFDIPEEHIELVQAVFLVALKFGRVVEAVKKGVFHQHGVDVKAITEELEKVSQLGSDDWMPVPEVTDANIMVAWNLMGLLGEACELIELWARDEPDPAQWAYELGDAFWYPTGVATQKGLPLENIFAGNIGKLKERYPDGFSAEDSRNREGGTG